VIAAVVSLLILYMPVEIITEVQAKESTELVHAWLGVLGTLVVIAIIYFISRYKIIVGRETGSPALEADGYHSRTDMFTSMAVVCSLMGQMIGLNLDAIVAVVIAVLIAITGLDLFFSSIMSLIKGKDVHEMSVWESFIERINTYFEKNSDGSGLDRVSQGFRQIKKKALKPKYTFAILGLILSLYMASGFSVVKAWEVGFKVRFGEVVEKNLQAGLHYHLPSPFESIQSVNIDQVRRVEVGYRDSKPVNDGLYENESIMLTGDEGVVDLKLVVHYRYLDATTHWMGVKDIEEILRGITESVAREVLSTKPSDVVLSEQRNQVVELVQHKVAKVLDKLQLGAQIVAVYVNDLQPPEEVIPTFRDVFSAKEDKARFLSEAQAYMNEALPKARGQFSQQLTEAESRARETQLHAEGDSGKFELLAAAYAGSPDITRYRLFLETMEEGLSGREKIVADPAVNLGEYRRWLFEPAAPGDQIKTNKANR
jgi:membrane protease subunit HflK